MVFVREIWRGNASLPFTYWVVAVIGNTLLSIVDKVLDGSGYYNQITDDKLVFIYAFIAISTVYYFFTLVSVWRSASKYEGKPVWAILAKTAMVIGTLRTIVSLAPLFQ